jgi:hypothetical protein
MSGFTIGRGLVYKETCKRIAISETCTRRVQDLKTFQDTNSCQVCTGGYYKVFQATLQPSLRSVCLVFGR